MDPSRVSNNRLPRSDISCHDCSSANDGAFANPYPWKHDGAGSNESELADRYFTGESCSRSNVDTVAKDAIVINRCPCVDDDGAAEAYAGAHGAHGQDLASVTDQSILGDEGTRVGHAERHIITGLEPVHAFQSITPTSAADSHTEAYLAVAVMSLFPLQKSFFAAKNRNVRKRRCNVTIVKEGHQTCIVGKQCLSQHFCLSRSAPENDRDHR